MTNMIDLFGLSLDTISIALLAVAAVIMILVIFAGPKRKSFEKQKQNEVLNEEVVPVTLQEPVIEETVAQQVQTEEIKEEVVEAEQPAEEQPVIAKEVVEEIAVVEETPVETVETAEEVAVVEEVAEPVAETVEELAVETAEETVIVAEPVAEDVVEEPVVEAEPAVEPVAEPVAEVVEEVAVTETKKLNIPVGKKLTFAEKMCNADEENQAVYNVLKNELMSYKKVSNRLTKVIDIFKYKSTYLAKIGLTGKTVKLHLALDPNEYATTKYHHQDLGEKKKYEFVPLALKVKSPRSQKYAIELIAGVMEKAGLVKNPKYQQVDYIASMKEQQLPQEEVVETAEE